MVDPFGNALPLQDAYRNCTDFAFKQVITGAASYTEAVRQATRNLSDKRLRVIDYKSGVHTSLEAAVRRNIMGGLGLMQEQISQTVYDQLGCDGWEITAHANSAPDHEPIQGKQYPDEEYQRLNNALQRRIGTLNCGHAAFPIILGVNSPQYTDDELEKFREDNEKGVTVDGIHYTGHQATQMQRKLEQAIRRQKYRIMVDEATGDAKKLAQDKTKLTILHHRYQEFSKAAGLRTQYERTEVAGFGEKQKISSPTETFDKQHLAHTTQELLPQYSTARIPDKKLSGYALNFDHPIGRNKAVAFQKALGYTVDNQDLLIKQVRIGLAKYKAIKRPATKYGQPFEVPMMIQGINGKFAKIKTGWNIDPDTDDPRLITIYVDE